MHFAAEEPEESEGNGSDSEGLESEGWESEGWESEGWESEGWESEGWESEGWESEGWESDEPESSPSEEPGESPEPMSTPAAPVNTVAPSGADIANALFGDGRFRTERVYAQNGTFVGDHVVLLGTVRRMVSDGTGGMRFGSKSYADVMSQIEAAPLWTDVDWNFFFGARLNQNYAGPDEIPSTDSPIVNLITWAVPVEQLAAPGGLGSDLVITATLVTEVTSFVDPTPVSDAIQVGIFVAQGDNGNAALAAAGMAVPGGFDKLAQLAKKIPVGKLAAAKAAQHAGLEMAQVALNKAGLNRGVAGEVVNRAQNRTQAWDVGAYNELKSRSLPFDRLDIHHAGQKHPMSQVIPGYDPRTAPAIAVPEHLHEIIPTVRGPFQGTAREQLAADIRALRGIGAPNERVEELIQLNKVMYPLEFSR